jgi:hypothetical protein
MMVVVNNIAVMDTDLLYILILNSGCPEFFFGGVGCKKFAYKFVFKLLNTIFTDYCRVFNP